MCFLACLSSNASRDELENGKMVRKIINDDFVTFEPCFLWINQIVTQVGGRLSPATKRVEFVLPRTKSRAVKSWSKIISISEVWIK